MPRIVMLVLLLVGSAVALAVGIFGEQIGEPRALDPWGFSSVQTFKAWLSTGVLVLVVGQLITATWIYGRIPGLGAAPGWAHLTHRLSGLLAVLTSLPVAWYCLYGYGFDTSTTRTLVHSVAGCTFYGAFVAKMLALRLPRVPAYALPLLGGLTFSAFVVAWVYAAAWWFNLVGFTR